MGQGIFENARLSKEIAKSFVVRLEASSAIFPQFSISLEHGLSETAIYATDGSVSQVNPFESGEAALDNPKEARNFTYDSPRTGVIGALYANMVVNVLDMLGSTVLEGTTEDAQWLIAFGMIQFTVFLTTVVLWSMWTYRAAQNIRVISKASYFEFTPGWAVGYYFIPILNLFRPMQAMKEIANWSIPEDDGDDRHSSESLVHTWWIFWIFSNVAANLSIRIEWAGATIFASGISIVSAVMAINLVRRINGGQIWRARAQGLTV